MKSVLKKGIAMATASLVGLTGLVGLLHMPFARSLLMKVGGCPIVRATPAQLEQAQNAAAARGAAKASTDAPTRPALGFELEKTTSDDVHAWIRTKGIACNDDLEGAIISCLNVPASIVEQRGPNLAELQFNFHPDSKTLRVVTTFREHLSREEALSVMNVRGDELTHELGRPRVLGQPDLNAGAASAVYILSYNFKDYLADETATQQGGGFAIAEHFVSQRNELPN